MWPTVIGKRDIYLLWNLPWNCGAFLWILSNSNFFYAPFYTKTQFTGSDYELCVWPRDKGGHKFVRKTIYSSLNRNSYLKTQQHIEAHSQFFFLSSHHTVNQMGHMCTDVPYTMVSYIKLSRDLFLSLLKWEQLHHRYLQQCSQPTYTSSKPLQKHPVPEISFKQRNSKHATTPQKSYSLPYGQCSLSHWFDL